MIDDYNWFIKRTLYQINYIRQSYEVEFLRQYTNFQTIYLVNIILGCDSLIWYDIYSGFCNFSQMNFS